MKNDFLRGVIVWSLAICTLALFSYAAISRYEPQSVNVVLADDYSAPRHEIDSKKEKTFGEALVTDPVAFFTMILAFFTMGLAAVTIALWLEAKRAGAVQAALTRASLKQATRSAEAAELIAKSSRLSAEQQLRAYIFLARVEFYCSEHPQQNACARVVFKNYGQTPAYNFRIMLNFELRPATDRFTVLFGTAAPKMRHGISAIGPDNNYVIDHNDIGHKKDEFESLRNAGQAFFAFGRADYVDAFGKEHWLEFQEFNEFTHTDQFSDSLVGNASDWSGASDS